MTDPRFVEVPEGCRVVFVTDQLVERYTDWSVVHPCEARAVSLRGGPVESSDVAIDVQTRYVARDVQPTGLLVLKAEERLSQHEMEAMADRWRRVAKDQPVVILDGHLELTELSDEDLAQIGLRRT